MPDGPPDTEHRMTGPEGEVVRLINHLRTREGLPTLIPSAELHRVSHNHAINMRDYHFFDHRDFKRRVGNWRKAGEVIASADLSIDSPDHTVEGWRHSKHHRERLLDSDYAFIGIARVTSPKEAFWVVDLGSA